MSGFIKKLMATGAVLTMGFSSASADNACCPPPCDPCASWCDNFSFNASWLYWKVGGDDFDYAVEKISHCDCDCSEDTVCGRDAKIHDVDFDWDSGFRLGFGFNVPCWCFDVNVDWTHFDTSSKSKTIVKGQNGLDVAYQFVPNYYFSGVLFEGETADFVGQSKIRYNVVDLEFSKWLCCNSCISLRPHFGFRGADIQERFNDTLVLHGCPFTFPVYPICEGESGGVCFEEPTGGDIVGASFHAENKFKGVGLVAGLDADFRICDGWSFIGRSGASVIWGTTHLKQRFLTTSRDVFDNNVSRIREDHKQARFITDLSFGVRYSTCACGCPVTLEAAWEHHYLFNRNRFILDDYSYTSVYASSGLKRGDVVLQGLTLSAGIDF